MAIDREREREIFSVQLLPRTDNRTLVDFVYGTYIFDDLMKNPKQSET